MEPPSGLCFATGFSGHGFQQGPVIGEHLAELALGLEPTFDLEPFSLTRFAEGHGRFEHNLVWRGIRGCPRPDPCIRRSARRVLARWLIRFRVKAARIPDRDRLLRELRAAGLEARPVGEVGIEVPCGDDAAELFVYAERVIMSIGAPFVPIKHEGTSYIRPPLS